MLYLSIFGNQKVLEKIWISCGILDLTNFFSTFQENMGNISYRLQYITQSNICKHNDKVLTSSMEFQCAQYLQYIFVTKIKHWQQQIHSNRYTPWASIGRANYFVYVLVRIKTHVWSSKCFFHLIPDSHDQNIMKFRKWISV